ncbi:hypothetical protein GOL94_00205 [Sinorhizobium medicae]|nr:hypothetical protein [Sinorhizobium medicae]
MFTEAQPHSNPAAKVFSREQLYELVWSTPVLRAARQLEVSNSYVARICSALDVPRPPRGWWARKKSGQTPVRPPLPPPRPGRPLSWSKEEWSGSITMYYQRREIWEASAKGMHPLVALATEAFSSAKARSSDTYLAPRANNVMDIVTTPGTLERALAFANLLSAALETRGHSIMVAAKWRFIRPCIDGWERPPTHCDVASIRKWAPRWPTVAKVRGSYVGLAIVEAFRETLMRYLGDGQFEPVPPKSRKGTQRVAGITWNDWQPQPTGRLKLVAYHPLHPAKWIREWQISNLQKQEREIEMILRGLEEMTAAQSTAAATT